MVERIRLVEMIEQVRWVALVEMVEMAENLVIQLSGLSELKFSMNWGDWGKLW